jgi:hypothetical protein
MTSDKQAVKCIFEKEDVGEKHEIIVERSGEGPTGSHEQAFGRSMKAMEGRDDGVLLIESTDGSPPDPDCERTINYRREEDDMTWRVRVTGRNHRK